MNILILGLGQSLRGDDAAGLKAVQLWLAQYPENAAMVKVVLCELPGLSLLDLVEGKDSVILVDAVHSPAPAGTVICIRPDELDGFTSDSKSAHGWGVAETLQLGRSLVPSLLECQITLIGIVGEDFSLGEGLSPGVHSALTIAAEMIEREFQVARNSQTHS
jgi:hydrogenase maturation protease